MIELTGTQLLVAQILLVVVVVLIVAGGAAFVRSKQARVHPAVWVVAGGLLATGLWLGSPGRLELYWSFWEAGNSLFESQLLLYGISMALVVVAVVVVVISAAVAGRRS